MADGRDDVQEIQAWLNSVFGSNSEWESLDEDGIAGWGTIRGIIRGLQLELGFSGTDVDGVFGNDLKAAVPDLTPPTSEDQTFISIAQSALRVKGYNAPAVGTGEFGHFSDLTVEALRTMCDDANYHATENDYGNPVITDEIWKGLCSQDAYVLVSGGDTEIRTIQRRLNGPGYQPQLGLAPADGIVTPQMTRALISAVQLISGIKNPDGYWGDNTQAEIPSVMTEQDDSSGVWADVLTYGLYLNGFDFVNVQSPNWIDLERTLYQFASFMRLNVIGEGVATEDMITALFISHGNQSRGFDDIIAEPGEHVMGIDLATRLEDKTDTFSNDDAALSSMHISFVGRYMQNAPDPVLDKEMTLEEIDQLLEMTVEDPDTGMIIGFGIAPIWQTSANGPDYFIPGRGTTDAQLAHTRADALGMPGDVTIFYAVDFDAFGSTIADLIVPYFEELNAESTALGSNPVGVYGPRAVCNELHDKGLASASFVGNLSYGWTGNLGQPMPDNWAIDQFNEIDVMLVDDDDGTSETVGADQLIRNPANGKLWTRMSR
ncbi:MULTISPECIES: glycoside hydrolase domain-containing protein [unclassified Brevibacterium]|uniref:glycoside hydrolase domain-containing protein n=1 Tax=unclassified Brevibacterium TaxID=2614124 RepID=UPI00186699A8|nr:MULTISPECIES: glycoside hydrolase domain-containing protein [unclassified Brevibacterium]